MRDVTPLKEKKITCLTVNVAKNFGAMPNFVDFVDFIRFGKGFI